MPKQKKPTRYPYRALGVMMILSALIVALAATYLIQPAAQTLADTNRPTREK